MQIPFLKPLTKTGMDINKVEVEMPTTGETKDEK
jgi:hypothetical protein